MPADDLNTITKRLKIAAINFQDAKFLISGGTGFIGKWLVSTLLELNNQFNRNIQIFVLTRNPFHAKSFLNHPLVQFIYCDLAEEIQINNIEFTHLIHGGVPTFHQIAGLSNQKLFSTIQQGTSQLIELCKTQQTKVKLLHLSSGAARDYEALPSEVSMEMQKLSPGAVYAYGKRISEKLIEDSTSFGLVDGINARLFAFYGPYLPLDKHFAIGNFMRAIIKKEQIIVTGNPSTVRTYMYPSTLIEILLKLLSTSEFSQLDVGGHKELTIEDLANTMARFTPKQKAKFLNPNNKPSHYVPNTENLSKVIDLNEVLSFDEGINKWRNWLSHSNHGGF